MRHQNTGRQLSRNSAHRQALMRNMASALLRHETIRTTLPKAKELRRVVEPLITLAKRDNVAKRRLAFARLRDDEVVAKLFNELGPHYATRPGGYTRILKHGFRPGDKAPMAVMQLVDREAPPQAKAQSPGVASAEKAARTEKLPKVAKPPKPGKPAKSEKPAVAEVKAEKKTAKADKQASAAKKPAKADKAAAKKAAKKPAK